eukprot:9362496-Lingulodinium_polyedra.AAC.1
MGTTACVGGLTTGGQTGSGIKASMSRGEQLEAARWAPLAKHDGAWGPHLHYGVMAPGVGQNVEKC